MRNNWNKIKKHIKFEEKKSLEKDYQNEKKSFFYLLCQKKNMCIFFSIKWIGSFHNSYAKILFYKFFLSLSTLSVIVCHVWKRSISVSHEWFFLVRYRKFFCHSSTINNNNNYNIVESPYVSTIMRNICCIFL